jgi:hypothetical protein
VTVEKANWEMGFFSDWASFLKQDVFWRMRGSIGYFLRLISSFEVICQCIFTYVKP